MADKAVDVHAVVADAKEAGGRPVHLQQRPRIRLDLVALQFVFGFTRL